MGESRAFALLHEGVRRWVWKQGWRALRDIQERAVEPILSGDCDVVLSAPTAAGKTEAAFLPACSHIARLEPDGIGILYISPLKALINDQYRRLQDLCDLLRLQVTPWHGDVGPSVKNRQRKKPGGVLLITPESLESLLLNQTNWIGSAFNGLRYLIIDEFHSFIGTERGRQLQSLMHRLEFLFRRTIPRIALSATLGELDRVAKCLRPNQDVPCEIIESTASKSDLKIQLRGYRSPAYPEGTDPPVFERVEDDLYAVLRGKSHLVFANYATQDGRNRRRLGGPLQPRRSSQRILPPSWESLQGNSRGSGVQAPTREKTDHRNLYHDSRTWNRHRIGGFHCSSDRPAFGVRLASASRSVRTKRRTRRSEVVHHRG